MPTQNQHISKGASLGVLKFLKKFVDFVSALKMYEEVVEISKFVFKYLEIFSVRCTFLFPCAFLL